MITAKRSTWVWISAIVAVVFGLMTIKSGGNVLFINGEARRDAGNYVEFILWFNFCAGFFYVVTGIGIWLKKAWAPAAAITIAVLTLVGFGALGVFIFFDGEYEQRTVVAMTLRSVIWVTIAITGHLFSRVKVQPIVSER